MKAFGGVRSGQGTLLQKLINLGILEQSNASTVSLPPPKNPPYTPRLKPTVEWIEHEDGYWILRNPEHLTFLQVDAQTKGVIEQFGYVPLRDIAQQQGRDRVKPLLQQLTATGMFEGTSPPKPKQGKWTPLQLLNIKVPLCNPDQWLTRHIQPIQWIWTQQFFITLLCFLAFTAVFVLHHQSDIALTTQQSLSHLTPTLILSFIVFSVLVIALHELAHAFTLKRYNGTVPEIGIMLMLLMPIAYTNTTDQYRLPKRRQRGLVVGAGVLCQLLLGAIAFWVWSGAATGSWLWTAAYLMMMAAVVTVAINLNPLAKFDGYYLAIALSGINNLRQRSFEFYKHVFTLQPSHETAGDRWILAAYAPFSLMYVLMVFGVLIIKIAAWILATIPITAALLLALWAIYYFVWPTTPSR
ncbi:hypothetical protein ACQ4M4_27035 [Leptolyngbya sp. AN02str]